MHPDYSKPLRSYPLFAEPIGPPFELITQVGSFAVTGNQALLEGDDSIFTLAALAGSFTISGVDATLEEADAVFVLTAQTGAFTISGVDATLEEETVVYILTAQAGTFTISGVDATLEEDFWRYDLTTQTGAFTVSGNLVLLEGDDAIFTLATFTGSFAISGVDSTLEEETVVYITTAQPGAFTVAGVNATLEEDTWRYDLIPLTGEVLVIRKTAFLFYEDLTITPAFATKFKITPTPTGWVDVIDVKTYGDDELYGLLVQWVSTHTGLTTIKAWRGGPQPARPYAMVNFINTRKVRQFEQFTSYEVLDTLNISGKNEIFAKPIVEREWEYSIHIFGSDPTSYLRKLDSIAFLAQANEPLLPQVVIHDVSTINNLSVFQNETWEPRAQCYIRLRGTVDDGTIIDTIDEGSAVANRF